MISVIGSFCAFSSPNHFAFVPDVCVELFGDLNFERSGKTMHQRDFTFLAAVRYVKTGKRRPSKDAVGVGIMWICVEPLCSSQQGLIQLLQ